MTDTFWPECFFTCSGFHSGFHGGFHGGLRRRASQAGLTGGHLILLCRLGRRALDERDIVVIGGVGTDLRIGVVVLGRRRLLLELALPVALLRLDLQRLLRELGLALRVDVEVEAPVDEPLRLVTQVGYRSASASEKRLYILLPEVRRPDVW